jgi:hypothetical protein
MEEGSANNHPNEMATVTPFRTNSFAEALALLEEQHREAKQQLILQYNTQPVQQPLPLPPNNQFTTPVTKKARLQHDDDNNNHVDAASNQDNSKLPHSPTATSPLPPAPIRDAQPTPETAPVPPAQQNSFLSNFQNKTGQSDEAVAAHGRHQPPVVPANNSASAQNITQGMDALQSLAAAAASQPNHDTHNSGGIPASPTLDYFYDDFPNPTHTMSELKVRQINEQNLHNIARIYAYSNYRITELAWKAGTRSQTRIYGCQHCDFRMCFRKVKDIQKHKFILTDHETYMNWKDAETHTRVCQSYVISSDKNAIAETTIVLNHPDFLKAFKDLLGDDPIQAAHIKTGNICTLIAEQFKTKYKHNAPFHAGSWGKLVNNMIDILHRKAVLQYTFLPGFLRELIAKNKKLTVMLQTDVSGRFLRLFVGFPAALLVGKLTMAFYVADCFHYKCSTYDGDIFAVVSKNGYGESVLLAIGIIPKEKTRHLGWCIECCVRHGMSFKFPLFTDQGPLLATASAFKIRRPEGYYLLIHLNIRICVIHFIRSTNHKNKLKVIESTIAHFVQQASRALSQAGFFSCILSMVETIVSSIDASAISNAVDVALYLLKVDPVHWCAFPNTPMFDQETFDTQLNDVIDDLYLVRTCEIHSNTLLVDDSAHHDNDTFNKYYNSCVEETKVQTKNFKENGAKTILKPERQFRGFWNWTTNLVEGASLATKSIGARYLAPPSSIKNILEYAANQTRNLTERISKSLAEEKNLTEIGYNIANNIQKQETDVIIDSIEINLDEDTVCADDDDNDAEINSIRCSMKGTDSSWTTTVTYGHTLSPTIRCLCERHIIMYDINCPCICVVKIFAKSKLSFHIAGVSIPDFAQQHTEFGNQLFHQVFPRCFQVDTDMRDDSISAHILVPSVHESNHVYHSLDAIDIKGKSVQATSFLEVPPKSRAKFWIDVKRIPSIGERGCYSVCGKKKKKGSNRESKGRFFCELSLVMSSRKRVKRTSASAIIKIQENPSNPSDAVIVDNKRKRSSCRHCGCEGHYITECESFHTFGQGIVRDDDPSMVGSLYLVYHAPNELSKEYLPFKDELGKPPAVEMFPPSEASVDDDDLLFSSTTPPEHQIQQSLALGRQPNNKEIIKNNKGKKKLEDRLLCYENNNNRPTDNSGNHVAYGKLVTVDELRAQFRIRKQVVTKHICAQLRITLCNKDQLCEELFHVRAAEKSDHASIAAVDVIAAPTAVAPLEPEPAITEPDSYTDSDKTYIDNFTDLVLTRSTATEPSLFVSKMLNLIPNVKDCCRDNIFNNQIPMEDRSFIPLSQETANGHDDIDCSQATHLDNPLLTQECSDTDNASEKVKNEDVVVDDVVYDDSDLDCNDDDITVGVSSLYLIVSFNL